MNKISSNFNNQVPNNDSSTNNNYTPSYLAHTGQNDSVSFSGRKMTAKEKKVGFIATIMAGFTALASVLGLGSCNNTQVSQKPSVAVVATADEAAKNPNVTYNANNPVEVVSIMSTQQEKDEKVEVKKFPSVLKIADDKVPDFKSNSTVKVVRTNSNEIDECTTLHEAINKIYVEPFVENGTLPEIPSEAEMHQMAREIIEDNEDMQKAIASHYNVSDWMEADIDKVLSDDLYQMGINEFETPDQVEIHGISSKSILSSKSESKTTLYSTKFDTIKLDNKIKDTKDLYSAFASVYKDSDGNDADGTAGSVATWMTIKNNQYNEAFEGKINNDGDRTDLMLLDVLKGLKDGEVLELNLPDTFGVNYTASGKSIKDVKEGQAYHIIHQMTPSESSFILKGDTVLEDDEATEDPYDFVDILAYYYDPDTEEKLASKVKTEDGKYQFRYNLNVADLNAKQYALFEQVAFDNINFFASKQEIDVDGKVDTYEFGVFDVQEGHEQDVRNAIAKGDYDGAKQFMKFNLDRFVAGSFYNTDGTLKTGSSDLIIPLKQFEYVNENEGAKTKIQIKEVTPEPTEPEPTKPEPTKPSEPEAPTTPVIIPTGPSDDPTEPTKPSEPTEPSEVPTEPTKPSEPTEPSEVPTEPTKPSEPTEPSEVPTEPTKPSEPTEPSEVPTEPTKPSEPTEPTVPPTEEPTCEPEDPIDPDVPTEPTKPSEPTEPPTEAPTEAPTERPTEDPGYNPDPTIDPGDDPTEPPTEAPTEAPTKPSDPTEPPTEAPTERPTEDPGHNPDPGIDDGDDPTEPPTEAPTEAPTKPSDPTEPPTEAPTEAPTERPTEDPGHNPDPGIDDGDDPTEPPTEAPTKPSDPTEPPTEAPTDPPCDPEDPVVPEEDPKEPPTVVPDPEPEPDPKPAVVPDPKPTPEPPAIEPDPEPQHDEPPCEDEDDILPDSFQDDDWDI